MLRYITIVFVCCFSCGYCLDASSKISPKEALDVLVKGNKRFAKDQMEHPDRSIERRLSVSKQQNPFAIILSCSDSRVSPEILFDVGIGDVFTVRVAGNVVGVLELETINFAVHYLNPSLIIILGHENCSAIKAVLTHDISQIKMIASLIDPSIPNKDIALDVATKENVTYIVNQLKKEPTIAGLINHQEIDVVGAFYNFDTSKVELL